MIDAEVLRLRRLRNSALKARALAAALAASADSESLRRTATLSASAAACWRVARAVTGRLRAHPNLNCQHGPHPLHSAFHGVSANVLAAVARYRGRPLRTVSQELRRVARVLDDARALTWSTELSDTFGRAQIQFKRLIRELDAGARQESGGSCEAEALEVLADARVDEGGAASLNWPYLAMSSSSE